MSRAVEDRHNVTQTAVLRMIPNAPDAAAAVTYARRALGSWSHRGEAYCHADPAEVVEALETWQARHEGRAA